MPRATLDGWVNIDQTLGLVSTGGGFRYTRTKGFNRRSVAYDQVVPLADFGAWQMPPPSKPRRSPSVSPPALADCCISVQLSDGLPPVAYSFTLPVTATGLATTRPDNSSSESE